MTSPATLRAGDILTIPLLAGEMVEGRVQLVQPESGGIVRVGGKLTGEVTGTFSLTQLPDRITGRILLTDRQLAYVITPGENGGTWLVEKALSEVLCLPYPFAAASASPQIVSPQAITVPILSSRSTAPAVIYLDFDGETVTDPDWNGGATIVAPGYALTTAQITEIWNRVKEDYLPFNVDVTTNLARYNAVTPGHRMRCIITSNDAAEPGAGGVAYVDSFSEAGTNFSTTMPCWVFNDGAETISEAVSHEVGHTLGLSHDGRTVPVEEYYEGHGTDPVSWGPIMGASYFLSLTQWSKGEYANANNHEDDLAIISSAKNAFGYIGDDAGDSYTAPAVLGRSGATINQVGGITRTGDLDYFAFNTGPCTVTITAKPATVGNDLDIRLDLLNGVGAALTAVNPDKATDATLTYALGGGVYFVKVSGTGRGVITGDGYSNYGSLGAYTLTGTIPGTAQVPFVVSPGTASGIIAKAFSYRIHATNTPTSFSLVGTLPTGLILNAATGYITGTPTKAGTYTLTMRATNTVGTGTKALVLTIASMPAPVISSATTASGTVGQTFQYQITATNSPTSYKIVSGTLPSGLTLNATTGLISGKPTVAVISTLTIGATNVGGTGTGALVITIRASATNLAAAVEATSNIWTTGGNVIWKVITAGSYDGVDAAQSGLILGNQTSWMQTTVTGPVTLSYRWKCDSELGYDFLRFKVDGTAVASISGAVAWQLKSFAIATGTHTVQWSYEKDYSASSGADAGYVDTVTIPPAPTRVISLSGNLAYGSVAKNSYTTRPLTLKNTGNTALSVTGITYPAGFSGAWSGTIAVGASQIVNVKFSPTDAATYSGTITVNSNKTSGTNTINASGTGTNTVTRVIALGGTFAYGSVPVGSSATRTLTLKNTGTAPLSITSITFPAGYSGAWAGTILPGLSQNVVVYFKPTAVTAYSGTITVNSNKTSGTNTVAASGTGIAATRVIALSGGMAFGSVTVGTTRTSVLTIRNTGNSLLTVSGITYPAGFSGAWTGTIPAAGLQAVTVSFKPTAVKTYSGTLTVNSNKTSGTNTLAVSGTGK